MLTAARHDERRREEDEIDREREGGERSQPLSTTEITLQSLLTDQRDKETMRRMHEDVVAAVQQSRESVDTGWLI